MAFLNNLKGAPMPPIKNVLKDAWQTAKQSIPDRQKQQQYEDPTSEYGGSSQVSSHSTQRPHNVHFADTVDESGQRPTELNPLNPFRNPNGYGYEDQTTTKSDYQYDETGFNQGEYNNYQQGGFPVRYKLFILTISIILNLNKIVKLLIFFCLYFTLLYFIDKEVRVHLEVIVHLLEVKVKADRLGLKSQKFKLHGM